MPETVHTPSFYPYGKRMSAPDRQLHSRTEMTRIRLAGALLKSHEINRSVQRAASGGASQRKPNSPQSIGLPSFELFRHCSCLDEVAEIDLLLECPVVQSKPQQDTRFCA